MIFLVYMFFSFLLFLLSLESTEQSLFQFLIAILLYSFLYVSCHDKNRIKWRRWRVKGRKGKQEVVRNLRLEFKWLSHSQVTINMKKEGEEFVTRYLSLLYFIIFHCHSHQHAIRYGVMCTLYKIQQHEAKTEAGQSNRNQTANLLLFIASYAFSNQILKVHDGIFLNDEKIKSNKEFPLLISKWE